MKPAAFDYVGPKTVAEAVSRCLIETNANLGGFFETTVAAGKVVDAAHRAMADFLGAAGPELGGISQGRDFGGAGRRTPGPAVDGPADL